MQNNLVKIFEFTSNKQVRVVVDEVGEPWFVAKDVCDILELDTENIRRLDDDEKGLNKIQTPGGAQNMNVINESGLYSLVLSSKLCIATRRADNEEAPLK